MLQVERSQKRWVAPGAMEWEQFEKTAVEEVMEESSLDQLHSL
jgi:hypothetical protein